MTQFPQGTDCTKLTYADEMAIHGEIQLASERSDWEEVIRLSKMLPLSEEMATYFRIMHGAEYTASEGFNLSRISAHV